MAKSTKKEKQLSRKELAELLEQRTRDVSRLSAELEASGKAFVTESEQRQLSEGHANSMREEAERLRGEVHLVEDHNKTYREDLDKAYESSRTIRNIAAVLAAILAPACSPPDFLDRFAATAARMGISSDFEFQEELKRAMRRGFKEGVSEAIDKCLPNPDGLLDEFMVIDPHSPGSFQKMLEFLRKHPMS